MDHSIATNERPASIRRTVLFLPELALLMAGLVAYYLFPYDLAFGTRILIIALFAMSLSLVLGQAGIGTLGHAAMYGTGAYTAGLWALHATSEPLSGLLVAAVAGGVIAFASGMFILRAVGLTLLMLTIAAAQVLLEVANKLRVVTGGDDGLSGYRVDPIFGIFDFDFMGNTGFIYALIVLTVCYAFMRRIVESPLGMTFRGVRSDPGRVEAIGASVYRIRLTAYTIGGIFAGIAGALAAQTNQVVSLHSLSFDLSAEALVIVVIGGTGRLVGALIGAPLLLVVHHIASAINPYHWQLIIGLLLIVILLFFRKGIAGLLDLADRRVGK